MELVALFICDRLWQQVYAQISFSEKNAKFLYRRTRCAISYTIFKKIKKFLSGIR